jgi:two-component system, LytTR family, sensor kinase
MLTHKRFLFDAIEQVRFPDRLRVEVSADPSTQEASVPQLILQPIVENAIRHGIGRSCYSGRILISASKINGAVELRVQDDGPGLSPGGLSEDEGIGLTNTRSRLQQLYGRDARLEIENCDRGGVIVTMNFPFRQFDGGIVRTECL